MPAFGAEPDVIEGYVPSDLYDLYATARGQVGAKYWGQDTTKLILTQMRVNGGVTDAVIPAQQILSVPDLLTNSDTGWPTEKLQPFSLKTWRHIEIRHGISGKGTRWPADMSLEERAQIIQQVAVNPDVVIPHHKYPKISNYLKEIGGFLYVLGIKNGDIPRTAFTVDESSSIMEAWRRWKNGR